MSSLDEFSDNGAIPPAPDEGWWAAVMQEDDRLPSRHERITAERPAGTEEDWEWISQLYENDLPVDLVVSGHNRGGLLVKARSLQGFVPGSHVLGFDPEQDEQLRERLLASKVDTQMTLKVIELEAIRGRLVFSERAALAGPGERNRILESLTPGDTVSGTVTNVTPFGVFLDLGGLEGLIHVSELSWGRVRHPRDVAHCGQEMHVRVVSINPELGRIGLSLKDLQPDPWESLDGKYREGELVEGLATNVVSFGVFVRLEQGLEGLIHESELGESRSPEEGERVLVRIIHMDIPRRRIGLRLKQALLSE